MLITTDASEIASILINRPGSVVAYPTETFYGLGSRIGDRDGILRTVSAKGRDASKGMIVLVPDLESACAIAGIDERQKEFLVRFWPGPLSALLPAGESIDPLLAPGGKVALRISPHPLALALTREAGPITSTSANPAGTAPATAPEEITTASLDIDAILDGGQTPGGRPSTLVDLTVWPPVILREGVIPSAAIFRAF